MPNSNNYTKSICILMPHFFSERVGGVEIQTYLIAKHLAKRTWDVHFIAQTLFPEKIGSVTVLDGIHVHWIKKRTLFSFFRQDISRLLKSINPALIYQRGRSFFTSSPAGYRFAQRYRKSLIYHCAENNDLVMSFSRQEVIQSKKNILKKTILYIHAFLSDYFFNSTMEKSNLVIAQTHEQTSRLKEKRNIAAHVIPSSHEIPPADIQKDAPPIVFWIAHAGRRKRLELFVELAKQLQGRPIQFLFAGTIPHEQYKNEIFSQTKELSNIQYIGPLTWIESNRMFAKASVFVNTTLPDREGFPNTYIQAWLHETPVVSLNYDPDGIIEKNGLGFHSRSFDQLVVDVLQLIENEELRRKMGVKARAYAMENHDIEKSADVMNDLLMKLLSRGL
ncbi:glycosyltransferase family 4 protein [bacterium]|nr:MAG: glycosyltransferase family 4 protein [bacterium]